jgi:hypothetical protein
MLSLDSSGSPWGKSKERETVYEVSWAKHGAKQHDGAGMRMRDAEALFLRELRLAHDNLMEFKGTKPLGENPKLVCLIYTNNQRSITTAIKLGYTTWTMFKTPSKNTCKEATTYWKVLPQLASVAKAKKTKAPPKSLKKESVAKAKKTKAPPKSLKKEKKKAKR